jgi:hypothetical protein
MAKIPPTLFAGDSISWVEPPTDDRGSDQWSSVLWLRFNQANEALTVSGSPVAEGWRFTISAQTSGAMDFGTWYWQRRIARELESVTVGTGTVSVERSLAYTGSAAAFDGRSQARQDLEAVQAAIRAIVRGGAVSEYTIGTRRLKKMTLAELVMLEDRLKRDVSKEDRAQKIANGLGDPRKLSIRFWKS